MQVRDALLAAMGRARVVVLCYHRIGGCDVLTRPAPEFRRDLEYLQRHFECLTLCELCRRLRSGAPLRRRLAAVTFDDGYRDNYTNAVPALQAAGVPATFFVSTGFMSTDCIFPHDIELAARRGAADTVTAETFPKLTWDDLRAMQAAGFEIGSHTVHHTNMGQADDATIERELRDSLAALQRELGDRPRAFAFPYGKPTDIARRALRGVQQAGYYAAVFAYGGANTRGTDPYAIQRLDAGNGYLSAAGLRARLAGLDPDYLRYKRRGIRFRE